MKTDYGAIARAHLAAGEWAEALAVAQAASQAFPGEGTWHHLAAVCYEGLQQPAAAAGAYRQALALDASNGELWCGLAQLLTQQQRIPEALAVYEEGAIACPGFWGLYLNWGNLLLMLGEPEAALAVYGRGGTHPDVQANRDMVQDILRNPAPYYQNLTQGAIAQRQWETAYRHYQRYLAHAPALDWATVQPWWQAVGTQALTWQEAALERFPEEEALHYEVMVQRLRGGDPLGAIAQAQEALTRFPENYTFRLWERLLVPTIYNDAAEIAFYRQRYAEGLAQLLQETVLATPEARRQALAGIGRFSNFYLNYQGYDDRPLQEQYGELVYRIVAANFPDGVQPLPRPPVTGPIRIGFLSQFLRSWSGTYLFLGWLQNLDPARFAVYAYALSPESDGITEQFRACSERFTLLPADPGTAAQQVRGDRLQV
ncbi:MAG: tetratricopeptide repeat protein, partial [Pseudanabaenaceae cyanobacterium]